MLQSMGSQSVRHDLVTKQQHNKLKIKKKLTKLWVRAVDVCDSLTWGFSNSFQLAPSTPGSILQKFTWVSQTAGTSSLTAAEDWFYLE